MKWSSLSTRVQNMLSRMGVRDRLLVVVLLTVAIALVTMTVAFNVLLEALLASDIDDRLNALVTDASRSLRIEGGGISLPRPAGDIKELGSQIWVFAEGKTVSSPAVDPDIEAAAKALQDQPYTFVGRVPEVVSVGIDAIQAHPSLPRIAHAIAVEQHPPDAFNAG